MGQVFLGRSAGGRLVAIKVIRPELAGDAGFRSRFAREVTAARNVGGLFTALVIDADVSGPTPWLATAYVAGPSLADAVESQGPLPVTSVLTLAAGLAEGLQAVHAAGLVHRDLKPSNILLANDGPRVIDFGISRAAEASVLTQSGTVMGSPSYMSPEQAEGGTVGSASDVFSLGAVLTFAATGQGPFGTGSTAALIYRVVHGQPDTTHLPSQIRPLIERCLAKDPSQRPKPADLLAELGDGQLDTDWLPTALTEILTHYAPLEAVGTSTASPPRTRNEGFPPGSIASPAEGTGSLQTVTAAPPPRTPTEAGAQAQPAEQDGPLRPSRTRRTPILIAALITVALLAGGITALVSTQHGGQTVASAHHSGQTLLPPGKYLVDREISKQDGELASLANVQISNNGLATFNFTETNETSGSFLTRCGGSPAPPSEYTVRLSNGQVDKAVADTCSDNPAWQVTNWQPGQTIVTYATFRNSPGFTQPFTLGAPGGPTVSDIRLSQGAS
jgi:serine/threonine protein kinase